MVTVKKKENDDWKRNQEVNKKLSEKIAKETWLAPFLSKKAYKNKQKLKPSRKILGIQRNSRNVKEICSNADILSLNSEVEKTLQLLKQRRLRKSNL
ncbi:uncharacterized protein CMU_035780 [Cryptosporidium muris RN66]|uniref:Uncharacterized protein n=1 Tax=Cryptosporidium muris (strain RN66) TaxID=441375 RepID=B6AGR4_CRYMR|nr:uncharacterized protein CMU_035780 [Cryptosporidium muris RN66]EEA07405.1 hypothetical protein CMU_035780 [Cryptosporidium muris RN66]|eukprot:XP_002141754.1 hypothetical protein [Cryptosporidium muris RN66]